MTAAEKCERRDQRADTYPGNDIETWPIATQSPADDKSGTERAVIRTAGNRKNIRRPALRLRILGLQDCSLVLHQGSNGDGIPITPESNSVEIQNARIVCQWGRHDDRGHERRTGPKQDAEILDRLSA